MIAEPRSEFVGRRAELDTIGTLLRTGRLVRFELDGAPERALNNTGRGFERLPVRVIPA
ncbi:hypothetical protein [Microbacterium sp. CIAB417]|uniref:hypothetical protein n=1 Tax=Microbacterium sp. CIAB417 TaxID=2860287 RepID=UPI001FACD93A|nr:hypothetical protein [Microbacterium sp. CIAB417]